LLRMQQYAINIHVIWRASYLIIQQFSTFFVTPVAIGEKSGSSSGS
jgi:hypothetical protein